MLFEKGSKIFQSCSYNYPTALNISALDLPPSAHKLGFLNDVIAEY